MNDRFFVPESPSEIEASAIDYRVSLKDGRRTEGSTSSESFVEYWSFLRRRGASTKPEIRGLIEGNCPNCGSADVDPEPFLFSDGD